MKVAVVGGSLQGVEATYLAHKAGWEVLVIDKKPIAPAANLGDTYVQLDVTRIKQLDPVLKNVDLVIPTTENISALDSLTEWSRSSDIPLAFDAHAYEISSSKLESDRLFADIGVPTPLSWPGCGFPLIAKPVNGSGSQGVRLFHNREQLEKRFSTIPPHNQVLQEYLHGPSYSLEIIGYPDNYTTLQVTGLDMDERFDCKRVLAPSQLAPEHIKQLEKISLKIASTLQLKGLMDVEAILHNNQLKILEIDARLPSQTPTAAYWSCGINMLEMLAQCFLSNPSGTSITKKIQKNKISPASEKGVVYEHIRVTSDTIEVCGEHIMTEGEPLDLFTDFFGADEVITNYSPGKTPWVATLIIHAASRSEAWQKRLQTIKNIRDHFKLEIFKNINQKNVAKKTNNDYNSPSLNKENKVCGFDLSNPCNEAYKL